MPVASLLPNSPRASAKAGAMARERNLGPDQITMAANPVVGLKPEYYVGIFNVSQTEIRIPRDWAVGGEVIIPARLDNELYSHPYIMKAIEFQMTRHPASDQMIAEPVSGEVLAQDVVNTSNPGGNWKTYRKWSKNQEDILGGVGNNYYERGLIWCRLTAPDAEPDMEAIEFAHNCLEANYNSLIQEANRFYSEGPKGQEKICAPHHAAADYFIAAGNELNLPWHQVLRGNFSSRIKTQAPVAQS